MKNKNNIGFAKNVILDFPGIWKSVQDVTDNTPREQFFAGLDILVSFVDSKPFANTLGVRHIAFAVEDIEAVVAKLKKKGTEIFCEIQQYKESYKLLRSWARGDYFGVGLRNQINIKGDFVYNNTIKDIGDWYT